MVTQVSYFTTSTRATKIESGRYLDPVHTSIVVIQRCFDHFSTRKSRFICNTSGSGKTRCILEGLMKYWGFYLAAIPDVAGVGVRDLHNFLNELHVNVEWESDLANTDEGTRYAQEEVNSQIASRHFRKLLAARIL
jgi:hypothetical protein